MTASIPSPGFDQIHVGPFAFHVYGLMYVFAVTAAVLVCRALWRERGGDPDLPAQVAVWGFPAGLIGGRLYHVVTSWSEVPHTWWGPFAIWKGGLGVIGGVALGTLVGVLYLRRRGVDVPSFMDAAAPGILVAQAIGRVGNYFNQELFGRPTNLPWGLEIDPAHRPDGYGQFATFHPTFLYEILWNLALAAVLVRVYRRGDVRPPGIFALYVAGYGFFRVLEELFWRIDPAHHFLGLRLNLFVAAALLAGGLAWFVRSQRRPAAAAGPRSRRPVRS